MEQEVNNPADETAEDAALLARWDAFRADTLPVIHQIQDLRRRYAGEEFQVTTRWLGLVFNQLLMIGGVDNPVMELGDFNIGVLMPLIQCAYDGSRDKAAMEDELARSRKDDSAYCGWCRQTRTLVPTGEVLYFQDPFGDPRP